MLSELTLGSRKRNTEFHAIPNKKKRLFWEDIANDQENSNLAGVNESHEGI
jgi:hypothetical protein